MLYRNYNNIYIFGLFFALCIISSIVNLVSARSAPSECQINPYKEPSGCSDFIIDSDCQARRILNPSPDETCCILNCRSIITSDSVVISTPTLDQFTSLNLFGTRFNIDLNNRKNVEMLINLGIITIISVIAIYALFRGAYLAGFVLPSIDKEDDASRVSRELRNLVFGFVLAVGSIVIVQLVFTVLGLGSLQDLSLFEDSNGFTIIVN